MLSKKILTLIFILFSTLASGQDYDSLYFLYKEGRPHINYMVKRGETLYMLSKRFHVPTVKLAETNGMTFQNAVKDSINILVPLGAYNYFKNRPDASHLSEIKRIYYKAEKDENELDRISHKVGIPANDLQSWNKMADYMIQTGEAVCVGWVLYDYTQVPGYKPPVLGPQPLTGAAPQSGQNAKGINQQQANNSTAKENIPKEKPKSKIIVIDDRSMIKTSSKQTVIQTVIPVVDTSKLYTSDAERDYMKQSNNETKIVTEKGPAIFFDMPGKSGNVFLVFHSITPRGTIIKIFNPGTGKAIYGKVLGPLPETKQYFGCVIGISVMAKEALGAKESKMWCELQFADPAVPKK